MSEASIPGTPAPQQCAQSLSRVETLTPLLISSAISIKRIVWL